MYSDQKTLARQPRQNPVTPQMTANSLKKTLVRRNQHNRNLDPSEYNPAGYRSHRAGHGRTHVFPASYQQCQRAITREPGGSRTKHLYAGASRSQKEHSQRSNQNGGGERDRTDDLLLAKQALSQLSYTPVQPGTRPQTRLTQASTRIVRPNHRPAPSRWWAWVDLNYRPHAYQACALTN